MSMGRRLEVREVAALAKRWLFHGANMNVTREHLEQLQEWAGRDGLLPFMERARPVRIGEGGGGGWKVRLSERAVRERQGKDATDEAVMASLKALNPDAPEGLVRRQMQEIAAHYKRVGEAVRPLPGSDYEITDQLPEGVLAQLVYDQAQAADRPNRNRRIYPYDDMKAAVAEAQAVADAGQLYSLGGHPDMCFTPKMHDIAGVIRKVGFNERQGIVPLELDVTSGEHGESVFNLLRVNAAIPISSRAWGKCEMAPGYKGRYGTFGDPDKDFEEVPETEWVYIISEFFFEGWDCVAGFQGVAGAVITPNQGGGSVMRGVEDSLQSGGERRVTETKVKGSNVMAVDEKIYNEALGRVNALMEQVTTAKGEAATAKAENTVLQREAAAAEKVREQAESLRVENARLKGEGEANAAKIKALESDSKALTAANEEIAALKKQIEEANKAKTDLEKALEEAKPKVEPAEVVEARRIKAEYEAKTAALEAKAARESFNAKLAEGLRGTKYGYLTDSLLPALVKGEGDATIPADKVEEAVKAEVNTAVKFVEGLLSKYRKQVGGYIPEAAGVPSNGTEDGEPIEDGGEYNPAEDLF